MNKTNIQYLDYTWNPTHGCSKVSAGCQNCWAKRQSIRLAGMGVKDYSKDNPFKVVCCPDKLDEPLRVKKPSIIGVSFMGDLFHDKVNWNFQYKVFEMMLNAPQHTFLILTKRPENANKSIKTIWFHLRRNYNRHGLNYNIPLNNVWLGVSVENNDNRWRIEKLLEIPAAVRFVSIEPMLGAVDLSPIYLDKQRYFETGTLDWVICGCESGKNRRPFNIEWADRIAKQCVISKTPFFFKQGIKNGKLVIMPLLGGVVWNQYPEDKCSLQKQTNSQFIN